MSGCPSFEGAASHWVRLIVLENSTLNPFEDPSVCPPSPSVLSPLCFVKLSGKKGMCLFLQEHLNHTEVGQVIIAQHIVVLVNVSC